MRYSPGEKRSSGELVDSQASPLPSSRAVGNVFALKRQELSTQHYCSRISHAASFLSLLTLGQTWGFYQGSALSSSDRAPKAPAPAPLCLTGNCRRLHNSVIHSQNDKLHVVTLRIQRGRVLVMAFLKQHLKSPMSVAQLIELQFSALNKY